MRLSNIFVVINSTIVKIVVSNVTLFTEFCTKISVEILLLIYFKKQTHNFVQNLQKKLAGDFNTHRLQGKIIF